MEKITFPNNKERNRALRFILGEQVIKVISDKTIGVSDGTAQKLRDVHGIKLRVKKGNSQIFCKTMS